MPSDDCEPFRHGVECSWCGRLDIKGELPTRRTPWGRLYHDGQCWPDRTRILGEGPPRPLPPAQQLPAHWRRNVAVIYELWRELTDGTD